MSNDGIDLPQEQDGEAGGGTDAPVPDDNSPTDDMNQTSEVETELLLTQAAQTTSAEPELSQTQATQTNGVEVSPVQEETVQVGSSSISPIPYNNPASPPSGALNTPTSSATTSNSPPSAMPATSAKISSSSSGEMTNILLRQKGLRSNPLFAQELRDLQPDRVRQFLQLYETFERLARTYEPYYEFELYTLGAMIMSAATLKNLSRICRARDIPNPT